MCGHHDLLLQHLASCFASPCHPVGPNGTSSSCRSGAPGREASVFIGWFQVILVWSTLRIGVLYNVCLIQTFVRIGGRVGRDELNSCAFCCSASWDLDLTRLFFSPGFGNVCKSARPPGHICVTGRGSAKGISVGVGLHHLSG